MTKLIALIALLFAAAAPAPEIIAKPVPFAPSHVETHFRGPLWEKGPGHRGIDISINSSSPILAPFDGSVFFAGEVIDRQVVTMISESGLKASFEPVCGLQPVGTRVSKDLHWLRWPTHSASLGSNPFAGSRGRPQGRAGDSWARILGHHPDLYPRFD